MAPTVPSTRQSPATKAKTTPPKRTKATTAASDAMGKTDSQEKDRNQERINRKRVQNRISQQCVREKQLAHQKRLEALADIIKTSTEADATSTESQNALLSSQMSLIEENRDLRDALLRMRKKMLSLSSAVAAVADDPIFEQILQKPRSKKKEKDALNKETPANDENTINVEPQSERNRNHSSFTPEQQGQSQRKHSSVDINSMSGSQFNGLIENSRPSPSSSSSTQSIHPNDDLRGGFGHSPIMHSDTFEYHMGDMIDQNMLVLDELNHQANSSSWNPYQIDFMSTRFVPEHTANTSLGPRTFAVVGENSWKIEQACIWYLSERFGIRDPEVPLGTNLETRSNYNAIRTALGRLTVDRELIIDVSKMAVNVMCRTSGFSDYIYGVGANVPMEQVFQWRLAPSAQSRNAIMEPFRPTPMQYMTTDYPIAIDMVNWPSIRDQLIFKMGSYDLDQVIADIVANTVIELPEIRAAINIHDTFFTRVFSKSAAADNEGSFVGFGRSISEGGFGEWESNTPGHATVGWTSNDVFRFLTQRMQLISDSRVLDSSLPADSWRGAGLEKRLTTPKQPLATKWGLDNLHRWKLSREFADAYPFLDCAGVTASFPLYSSKMLPEL